MPLMKFPDPPDACFELVIDARWRKPDAPDGTFIPTRVKIEVSAKYNEEWRRCVRCVRRSSITPVFFFEMVSQLVRSAGFQLNNLDGDDINPRITIIPLVLLIIPWYYPLYDI